MAAKTKEQNNELTMDDKGMIRVLVYGTLKEGHSNHSLLEEADAKFIGYDSVTGPFNMFDLGGLPAVMDAEPNKEVPIKENRMRGELWAVHPEGLAALDLLEGHPNFYQRRKLWTDIHKRRAWMYFLVAPGFVGDVEPKALGLWHGSSAENKFWLKESREAAPTL